MVKNTMHPFDINDYLNKNSIRSEISKEPVKLNKSNNIKFDELWKNIKEHFDSMFDSKDIPLEEKERRNELQELATIGKEKESNLLKSEIEEYLRTKNLLGVEYPSSCYDSLTDACFHEIFRFGVFAKWNKYPESVSAKIRGTKILFKINGKFERQEEELREGQIDEIIRTLQMRVKGLKINESNPSEEFDMDDGTRVKVLIPPRVAVPTIIFRRYVLKSYTFEALAKYKTIPVQDVYLYKILSDAMLNTAISGGVESGKSHLLKTMYAARNPQLSAILIEPHPETFLWRDFPERDHDEIYLDDTKGDIQKSIRDALRIDHDFVMFQEVRGYEAEGAIGVTERGTRGLLMTYHITNPKNTPRQLAQHIIDAFPGREQSREIKRIAENLDIGITMKTLKADGSKRITSVYEICYDERNDRAWINYLIKWNQQTDTWEYNANMTDNLKERIKEENPILLEELEKMLHERAKVSPIKSEVEFNCI